MTSPKGASPIASARPALVLASESPRRLALLAQAGIVPDACRSRRDRRKRAARTSCRALHALRLAAEKARAAQARHGGARLHPGRRYGGGLRPPHPAQGGDDEEVRACLALLSGRRHQVMTAVALLTPDGQLAHPAGADPGFVPAPGGEPRSRPMSKAAKAWARPAAMPSRAAPRSSSRRSAAPIPMWWACRWR